MKLFKNILGTVSQFFLLLVALLGTCPSSAFQLAIPSYTIHGSSFQQLQKKSKQNEPARNTISKTIIASRCSSSKTTKLQMASDTNEKLSKEQKAANDKERLFWLQQARLAQDMAQSVDSDVRAEQNNKYEERLFALVSDSAFFSVLIFSAFWIFSASPSTPLSYLFGALLGTAYSYGLGKYVGMIGGSIDDEGAIAGAGVGQARFAFLILLFIFVGKFRSQGLQELPTIGGFFTYQLASLSQGLKEYDD